MGARYNKYPSIQYVKSENQRNLLPSSVSVPGFKLKKPRAFAAVVQLKDGRFWVLGGISRDSIEDSTELIEFDKKSGAWKVRNGPKMTGPRFGHCAMLMEDREVLTPVIILSSEKYGKENEAKFAELGILVNI